MLSKSNQEQIFSFTVMFFQLTDEQKIGVQKTAIYLPAHLADTLDIITELEKTNLFSSLELAQNVGLR